MRKKCLILIMVIIIVTLSIVSCSTKSKQPTPEPMNQPLSSEQLQIPVPIPEVKAAENVYLEEENVGGITQAQLIEKINGKAAQINADPINAKVDALKWSASGQSKAGKKVNVDSTVKAVLNANSGDKVKLVVEDLPAINADTYNRNIVQLSAFTTKLFDKDEGRLKNIRLASDKINYKKIGTGEIFSFNGIVGARSEAKGYEEAPVIIKTEDGYEKGTGIGGGICQLSTTIYNAAEKSGMEIVERYVHSKKIGYVAEGKDATVSYGGVDFKFRNTKSHPIMVRVYISNNSLTVKLFENKNQ